MGFRDKAKKIIRKTGNFVGFGSIDRHEAKKITKNAKNKEENARNELENQRIETQKFLESLGEQKSQIYTSSLSDFVSIYEKIGKISLKPMKDSDSIFNAREYKLELVTMKKVSANIKEIGITAGGGALGGAIAVGGAWGLAGLIGTASTGTAIGTLSGGAATNATLAWLGGGALSAGGAGMAGGMVVLGGVALAPIAVFAMFMGTKKGQQELNTAKDDNDQVDVLIEKIKTLIAELYQIQKGVKLVGSTLVSLDDLLNFKLDEMKTVVKRIDERPIYSKLIIDPIKRIFNIDIFTESENQIIVDTVNCVGLINKIINKPLLNEEGAFLSEAFSYIEEKREQINGLLRKENLPLIEEDCFV